MQGLPHTCGKAVISVAFLALFFGDGCATRSPGPVFTEFGLTKIAPEPHVIAVGESLTIMLGAGTGSPMSAKATVDEEGWIELPDVGRIQIVGMTDEEAQYKIWKAYYDKGLASAWPAPELDRTFTVIGEVKRPDRYLWLVGTSLSKAIESCGGFTRAAKRSKLVLKRKDGSVQYYDYRAILKSPANDPPVKPGDLIEVTPKFAW